VTVDEELNRLDDAMRRLKIEYDVYFGGGSKKPPADMDWRVQHLIKKFADSGKLNFNQRFKYNSLVQRYAIFNDLWRKKLKIKEEGYSRPQDAMLGIQGLRTEEEHAAEKALEDSDAQAGRPFIAVCSDANSASFDSFKTFVKKKTEQLRKEYGCHAVEYSVETENGQVRLKARAKTN
jgi:hypothetical protein